MDGARPDEQVVQFFLHVVAVAQAQGVDQADAGGVVREAHGFFQQFCPLGVEEGRHGVRFPCRFRRREGAEAVVDALLFHVAGVAEFVGVGVVAEGQDAGVEREGIAGVVGGVDVESAEVKAVAVGGKDVVVAVQFFLATRLQPIDALRLIRLRRVAGGGVADIEDCGEQENVRSCPCEMLQPGAFRPGEEDAAGNSCACRCRHPQRQGEICPAQNPACQCCQEVKERVFVVELHGTRGNGGECVKGFLSIVPGVRGRDGCPRGRRCGWCLFQCSK